jgi:hypothetical protein
MKQDRGYFRNRLLENVLWKAAYLGNLYACIICHKKAPISEIQREDGKMKLLIDEPDSQLMLAVIALAVYLFAIGHVLLF